MRLSLKYSHGIAFLAVAVLAFAGAAYATPVLDFGVIAPTSGVISFAGGVNPLVGTNIEVDEVVGLDTLLNNHVVRNLFNATLNFSTGAHLGGWQFGGGPATFITIVGGVDLNGNGVEDSGDIPSGTTLLSGQFGTASVFNLGGVFHIAGSAFSDTKDPDLLEFYGLPSVLPNGDPFPYNGSFNISFNAPFAGIGNAFTSSKVLSGDITNSPVPEPSTILLLGLGIFGFGAFAWRRQKKNAA